jgi:predicted phage-related endonuclease
MSIDAITSLVEQYAEARQLADAAQAEMETLKAQISAEMQRRGVDQLDAGTHRVALSTVTTSRIDTKALKAAMPDSWLSQWMKTTTGIRFSVT